MLLWFLKQFLHIWMPFSRASSLLGCSLLYWSEADLYSVIMRLHSCPSLSLSLWPLNCFLEAGDFGQGDKGSRMKHSRWLSFSTRQGECAERGTFTETEGERESRLYSLIPRGQRGGRPATAFKKPPPALSATKQVAYGWKMSKHTVDSH